MFHLHITEVMLQGEAYAFDLCVDVKDPINEVEIFISCFSFRWASKNEMNHNLNFNARCSAIVDIGELYGLVSIASVRSVHHIVKSNNSI